MSLNEIKERLAKDFEEKAKEIMHAAKKDADQIITDAEKAANEIKEKAREDAAKEVRNMQVKYESEMDFEKSKEIRLAREHVIEAEVEKIRPVFIKEMQKQMHQLLYSGIQQMLKTLPENEIYIDISKKMAAANPAVKKYLLNYKEQEGIVIHDKEYKIKIIINPEDIFNENINIVKQAIAKELFGNKKESKKNNAVQKPKKQKKNRV
jgi:vacuolar-type H+-ATPase subunit E/Vma4